MIRMPANTSPCALIALAGRTGEVVHIEFDQKAVTRAEYHATLDELDDKCTDCGTGDVCEFYGFDEYGHFWRIIAS